MVRLRICAKQCRARAFCILRPLRGACPSLSLKMQNALARPCFPQPFHIMLRKKEVIMITTTWFVSCNSSTNDKIRQNLPEENIQRSVTCIDLQKRQIKLDLWECDFKFVQELQSNKKNWKLSFRVFRRVGPYGRSIREAPAWLYDESVPAPKKSKTKVPRK